MFFASRMSLLPPIITESLAGSKDKGDVFFNKAKRGSSQCPPTAAYAGAAFFQKDFFVSTGATADMLLFPKATEKKAD
jgi:hypothetical protein